MRTRYGRTLMVGLVLVGLLAGCATTVTRQDQVGLPTAENPEYLDTRSGWSPCPSI